MSEKLPKNEIYVYLLDEGVDAWRPVEADKIGDDTYRIPEGTRIPETETWQFQPGTIVRCSVKKLSDGERLVAVEQLQAFRL